MIEYESVEVPEALCTMVKCVSDESVVEGSAVCCCGCGIYATYCLWIKLAVVFSAGSTENSETSVEYIDAWSSGPECWALLVLTCESPDADVESLSVYVTCACSCDGTFPGYHESRMCIEYFVPDVVVSVMILCTWSPECRGTCSV